MRTILTLAAIVSSSVPASALTYDVLDLGGLTTTGLGHFVDMSNSGLAIGYYLSEPAIWDLKAGTVQQITSSPGGAEVGQVLSINDAGIVAGTAESTQANFEGALWDSKSGELRKIGLHIGYDYGSVAGPINNTGTVLGFGVGDHETSAFIWDPETGAQMLTPDYPDSHPGAINDAGQIALQSYGGSPTGGARIEEDGTVTVLEAGGSGVVKTLALRDINASGQIAGVASTTTAPYAAFVWDDLTGFTILEELPGGSVESYAQALSDMGQVLGISYDEDGAQRVVWDTDGSVTKLGDLDLTSSDWVLRWAYEMNGNGQILASASRGYGTELVLLDPVVAAAVPLPASLPLLIGGGVALLGFARRDRRRFA